METVNPPLDLYQSSAILERNGLEARSCSTNVVIELGIILASSQLSRSLKKEQKRSRERADPALAHKQYRTSSNLCIPNKNTYSTHQTEARWHETRPELVAKKDVVTNKQRNK